jgi:large subunit ribosomal protein L10
LLDQKERRMARPEKAAAVAEITERFRDSEAAILTEYRGLRVADIAEVRNALRGADADYKVLKNTLARIAAKEVGIDEAFEEMLTGPTAIVFVKDDVAAAAKALDDVAKNFPVLVVKGGVMQGRLFDADQAKALAKLEPREVQLSKIAGMMNQPAQQVANVLSALLRNFGSMLAQVVTKKESGELPGGTPSAETPAEAAPGTPEEIPGEPPTDDEGAEGDTKPATPEPGTPAEVPGEPEAKAEEPAPEATAEPAETPEAEEQAEAAPESEAAANEEVTDGEKE